MVSKRLIFKLYLWLLLALTLSVAGGALTVALLTPGGWEERTQEFLREEIGALRDVAQNLLAAGLAPDAMAEALAPMGRERDGLLSIQRADGSSVLRVGEAAELEPELRLTVAERERALAGEMVLHWSDTNWPHGDRHRVALPIALEGDEPGVFVVTFGGYPWRDHGVPWRLLAGLAGVLGVLWLLSWPLASHLARPLQRMAATADALGQGDLSARIEPRDLHPTRWRCDRPRHDEIGRLAQSFNRMAENLQRLVLGHKQLLADISHELRSPLARLRLALELARGAREAEQVRYLETLERQADAMETLIGELLFYARLDATPHDLRPEAVTPAALAADALNAQRPEADARAVRLEARVATALPTLQADRRLLERALGNVLRNAVAVSPAGGHVELTVIREPGRLVFTVSDEGPGVASELCERIFQPFVRADAARSRSTGGVGLGLAIVRRCMEAHGGGASASAGPEGRGLAVRLWLPLPAGAGAGA